MSSDGSSSGPRSAPAHNPSSSLPVAGSSPRITSSRLFDSSDSRQAQMAASSSDSPPVGIIKLILLGTSNVGKTSILNRFCDNRFEPTAPTIGVDFKSRDVTIDGAVWRLHVSDSAGQESYRVISKSYFRQADGVVLVYDVTDVLSLHELDTFIQEARDHCPLGVPMILLGNKADLKESHRPPGPNPHVSPSRASSAYLSRRSEAAVGGAMSSSSVNGGGHVRISVGTASQSPRFSGSQPVGQGAGTVTREEGERYARRNGIQVFFETSAQDGTHVDEAFEVLCRHVLNNRQTNGELRQLAEDHRNGAAPGNATGVKPGAKNGGPAPVKLLSRAELERRNKAKGKKDSDCPC